MLKKHVFASILALTLTFFSGSQNFAFASTTTSHKTTQPSAKAALCSGPLLTPWCGKIIGTCKLGEGKQFGRSVALVPQEMSYEVLAAPAQDKQADNEKPHFAYTYTVAQVSPTPTIVSTAKEVTPTPTVEVQAAVAYNDTVPSITQSGGLNSDVIFSLVNQIRASHGLEPFAVDDRVCAIANERAPELYAEIYVNGNMHAGLARRQPTIPFLVTENMISQNTEQEAVNWWMNSYIHRSAILGSHTHGCVRCEGNNCVMVFTSFIAK